jgi:hypothetical protein
MIPYTNAIRSLRSLLSNTKKPFIHDLYTLSTVRHGNADGLGLPAGVSGSVLVLPGGEVMQIGQTIVPSSKTVAAETSDQSWCNLFLISVLVGARSFKLLILCTVASPEF